MTTAALEGLTPGGLDGLSAQADGTPSDSIGKIITSSGWYFSCNLTEQEAEDLYAGASVTLRFRDTARSFPATVKRVSDPEDGRVNVTFYGSDYAAQVAALREQGVTEVLVQPTHILRGHEYDRLQREAEAWRDRFETLRVGKPLLADTEDLRTLSAALSAAYPPRAEETLMLIGHGTDHAADMTYSALQTAFRLLGRTDVLVGTVEGWPAFDEVLAQLRQRWGSSVHLVPLLLVAGDHARNDMAGSGPDSWRSRLEAEGYTVRVTLRGLGLLPAVRELYRTHLVRALEEGGHGL